jgi:hypothetical protein
MLTFATDFWPLFGTIVGAGALLTVLLTLVVAKYTPGHSRHFGQAELIPVEIETEHTGPYRTEPSRHAA